MVLLIHWGGSDEIFIFSRAGRTSLISNLGEKIFSAGGLRSPGVIMHIHQPFVRLRRSAPVRERRASPLRVAALTLSEPAPIALRRTTGLIQPCPDQDKKLITVYLNSCGASAVRSSILGGRVRPPCCPENNGVVGERTNDIAKETSLVSPASRRVARGAPSRQSARIAQRHSERSILGRSDAAYLSILRRFGVLFNLRRPRPLSRCEGGVIGSISQRPFVCPRAIWITM